MTMFFAYVQLVFLQGILAQGAGFAVDPPEQYEGESVTIFYTVGHRFDDWFQPPKYQRKLALEFAHEPWVQLASYDFKQRRTIIPNNTGFNLTADFRTREPVQAYRATINMYNLSCENLQTKFMFVFKILYEGEETSLPGDARRIKSIARPTTPTITIDGVDTESTEKDENQKITLKCSSNGPHRLSVRWIHYSLVFEEGHALVMEDMNAMKGPRESHPVCGNKMFHYLSTLEFSMARNKSYSVYYCAVHGQFRTRLAISREVFIFPTLKPVPAKTEGKLAPGLPLLNEPLINVVNTSGVYHGQKLDIYCNTSIANIPSLDVGKTLRLRLSYIMADESGQGDEKELKTMSPFVSEKNPNKSITLFDSFSEFTLLKANDRTENNVSDATLQWTIHQANCVGKATFKCTVWYAGKGQTSATTGVFAKSSYQHIDFQCSLGTLKIVAHDLEGTGELPEIDEDAQFLNVSCQIMGPRSITWNITGYGGYIYVGNSTYEKNDAGILQREKDRICRCFDHHHAFSVAIPELISSQHVELATCQAVIPGVAVKTSTYIAHITMRGQPTIIVFETSNASVCSQNYLVLGEDHQNIVFNISWTNLDNSLEKLGSPAVVNSSTDKRLCPLIEGDNECIHRDFTVYSCSCERITANEYHLTFNYLPNQPRKAFKIFMEWVKPNGELLGVSDQIDVKEVKANCTSSQLSSVHDGDTMNEFSTDTFDIFTKALLAVGATIAGGTLIGGGAMLTKAAGSAFSYLITPNEITYDLKDAVPLSILRKSSVAKKDLPDTASKLVIPELEADFFDNQPYNDVSKLSLEANVSLDNPSPENSTEPTSSCRIQ